MNLFDLDDTIITNRQCSTDSKDGVFSSFFDIHHLYNLCLDHGLDFAHNMYLIPGMKILRINGYLKRSSPAKSVLVVKDKGKGKEVPRKKIVRAKADPSKEKAPTASINTIQKELTALNKRKTNFLIHNNIRQVKNGWIRKRNSDVLSEEEEAHNRIIFDQVTLEINFGISLKKQELQNTYTKRFVENSFNGHRN